MADVRVLVLDDHEVVRRGICDILDRAEGVEVVAEAGSVAQAVRRADAVRPDVILSDLRLPDGTGLDVIAHVRESLPDTHVVVLTSLRRR
ncbi:response regulator [Demequina litorisediminis]